MEFKTFVSCEQVYVVKHNQILVMVSILTSGVTSSKSLKFAEPQLLHLN